ncbi:MAG: PilZ domain-containing protein [Candidatus Eremiobacteraeota bacterium]|nr:PilZ domain-containing protein [Candidatus Eremiobacteraeota bacterium]
MIQRDATPSNRRTSFRQKLDIPIEVKIQGLLGEPNRQATLMDLSSTGCRIRSQVTYDMGTRIGFDLPTGGKHLKLTGAIVSREKSVSSFIFDYGITFANLSATQKEAIVQQLMNYQRRDAVAFSFKKQADTNKDAPQTRLTYREAVTFPVTFMHGQSPASTGHATDISMDGIRLWCGTALQNGARVHLTFTLPEYVLYPDADPEDPTPRATGKHPQGFKEMSARGVVVARLASNEKKIPHGVKFVDLHPVDREELARFIHLLQLYKLARAKGQQAKRPSR